MNTKTMFSSATGEWSTPPGLVTAVNSVVPLDLDVCATPENAKCARYYTEQDDGLIKEWRGTCWMNPPYGREIAHWMRKAWFTGHHTLVVCLVPARTDTRWWHEYVIGEPILYFRGRLRFGNGKSPAPFPSALVLEGGDEELKDKVRAALTAAGYPCCG
jgi:phage N-6-adenine-methyltransferase